MDEDPADVKKRHFDMKKLVFFFSKLHGCKNTAFLQKYILVEKLLFYVRILLFYKNKVVKKTAFLQKYIFCKKVAFYIKILLFYKLIGCKKKKKKD